MTKGKSPGPDGHCIKFYQECWPKIKNEIFLLLANIFAVLEINENFKSNSLTLIYKKIDREQLDNYCRISLLNYDPKFSRKFWPIDSKQSLALKIRKRVRKITCFCFNYKYNLKFSITVIQVQAIVI